jgi:7 transmembrane sweet-taste receptor of 3 GCPR
MLFATSAAPHTLSPLESQHWRVNRLMLHKGGQRISLVILFLSVAFLVCLIFIVQGVFTASGEYGWERVEIDAVTGESIGRCTGYVAPCLLLTAFFLFVPVSLAGLMAYKTLGVDDLYSESKWVLIFILVQFQVYLVGAPVLLILRKVSPDGRFIGETLLIWTVPMSTIGLIIFPKVLLVRKMRKQAEAGTSGSIDAQDRPSVHSGDTATSIGDDGPPGVVFSTLDDPTLRGPRIQIVTFDD